MNVSSFNKWCQHAGLTAACKFHSREELYPAALRGHGPVAIEVLRMRVRIAGIA
jgi:hypothetical protein